MSAQHKRAYWGKDGPSGQDLLDQLGVAANAKGVSLTQFVAPLATSAPENFIRQLGRADHPLPQTIARVNACIAGEPIPPPRTSPFKGCTGRQPRPDTEHRFTADEIERRRRLTDLAHAERRPGETVEAALKRLINSDREGGAQ